MFGSKRISGILDQLQAARNLSRSMETGLPVRDADLQMLGLDKSLSKHFKL